MHHAISLIRTPLQIVSVLLLLGLLCGCESSTTKDWWQNPSHWNGTVTYTEQAHEDNVPVAGAPGTFVTLTYNNTETVRITGAVNVNVSEIHLGGTMTQTVTLSYSITSDQTIPTPSCSVQMNSTQTFASTPGSTTLTPAAALITIYPDDTLSSYGIDYNRTVAKQTEQQLNGMYQTSISQKVTPTGPGCSASEYSHSTPKVSFSAGSLPKSADFAHFNGHGPWPENLHDHDIPKIVPIVFDDHDALEWTPEFPGAPTNLNVDRTLAWNITYTANP